MKLNNKMSNEAKLQLEDNINKIKYIESTHRTSLSIN